MIGRMPTDVPGEHRSPSRRAVLAAGAGGLGALTLSACGIRLEDDAPRVPLVPTREPLRGESFLVALWRHTQDLEQRAAQLEGAATGLPARLVGLHRSQRTVLEAELVRLGVPRSVLGAGTTTAAPTTTTTTATSPSTGPSTGASTGSPTGGSAAASARSLGAAEASDLGPTAIAALAGSEPPLVALVGAVLAQRSAAATLLGAPATWPAPSWTQRSLAASYLETSRAAVYAFEVVTAQTPRGAQRTLATATLAALRARASAQEALAGDSAPPPALAYTLPFAVTTPAAARRLAVQALTGARGAVAGDLTSTGGDVGPLTSVVQWLGETEVLASRWGVRLAPFPGLV